MMGQIFRDSGRYGRAEDALEPPGADVAESAYLQRNRRVGATVSAEATRAAGAGRVTTELRRNFDPFGRKTISCFRLARIFGGRAGEVGALRGAVRLCRPRDARCKRSCTTIFVDSLGEYVVAIGTLLLEAAH
jgi:hypothetical protein